MELTFLFCSTQFSSVIMVDTFFTCNYTVCYYGVMALLRYIQEMIQVVCFCYQYHHKQGIPVHNIFLGFFHPQLLYLQLLSKSHNKHGSHEGNKLFCALLTCWSQKPGHEVEDFCFKEFQKANITARLFYNAMKSPWYLLS